MFKLYSKGIILMFSLLPFISCGRIKDEGNKVYEDTKTSIKNKKDDVVDDLINTYDPYHPDTKYNRKRFTEFFLFSPTEDVKNLYCYADEMGIDHKYQFSFNCSLATINRIINNLKLEKGTTSENRGIGLWVKFPWWDAALIETLDPYYNKGEHKAYWYLWYDGANQKAYYFSFDM
jgi:hypothetical protein